MGRNRALVLGVTVACFAILLLISASGTPHKVQLDAQSLGITQTSHSTGSSSTTVTISDPVQNEIIESTSVTIYWNATNNGAGINHFSIQLDLGTPISLNDSTHRHAFNGLNQSFHTVVVTVFDDALNTNYQTVTFVVDQIPPAVSITYPSSGSYINSTDVNVTWVGIGHGWDINQYYASIDTEQPILLGGDATSMTFPDLTQTRHIVTVTAFDRWGKNESSDVIFYVDSIPPSISMLSPENGHAFNQTTATISWKGNDSWSGIAHYEVWLNGIDLFNASSDSNHSAFTGLKDGSYSAMVKAVDRAGNSAEATISFVIDTVDPTLDISSPENGADINQPAVTVKWSGEGTGSSISYSYSIDSSSFTDIGTETSHQFEALSSGPHIVSIKAMDAAGNHIVKDISFIVDLGAPSLVINFPSEGGLSNSSSVQVSWEAHDDSALDHYEVKVDDESWTNVNLVNNYLATMLSSGPHVVQVKALDKSGNFNLSAIHFTVDLEAPTITDHSPTGEEVSVSDNITVSFSEAMNPKLLRLTMGGSDQDISLNGNTLTFDPSTDLQYGAVYVITVDGKDLAGNSIHYEWSFRTSDMGSISGRILNNAGSPVKGANVSLDTGEWAMTDADGNFLIHAHAGNHSISVSYTGMDTERMQVVVEAGGTKQVGDVQITPASLSLSWIVAVAALIVVGFLIYLNYQKKQRTSVRSLGILKKKQPTFLSKKQMSLKKKHRKPPEDEF